MNVVVDNLTSVTDWTTSDATKCLVYGMTDFKEYIANDNSSSLILKFLANSENGYCQKLFTAIDVTNYDYLILHVYSGKNKQVGTQFNNDTDYLYSITLNDSMTPFYIPLYTKLTPIFLSLEGITSIDRIRMTSLHNNIDYLILSTCLAIKDAIPLDLYTSFQSLIEKELEVKYNNGINVGAVTGTALNTSITITGDKTYLEKYAVITIDDGVNNEQHQLMDNDEEIYKLGQMFDGVKLLHNYINATVYLNIPVSYGMREKEIILPSVNVYGMKGDEVLRGGKVTSIYDSYKTDGTISERKGRMITEWEILFDVVARHDQLIAEISECVRRSIGKEGLWVNGLKYDISVSTNPVYIEPQQAYNEIPKVVYSAKLEIKEELYPRVSQPATSTVLVDVIPVEQGEI